MQHRPPEMVPRVAASGAASRRIAQSDPIQRSARAASLLAL
jgi:hypothetical protein